MASANQRLQNFWREFRTIFFVILVSRVALTLLGVAVRSYSLPFTHGRHLAGPVTNHLWLNVWGVWDTGWYMRIAEQGYRPSRPLSLAFFPLYPGLVRILGAIVGHHFVIGLLIANISLLVSAWLLYRFVKTTGGTGMARWAVWFLLAFPSAFVLSGMFTESLFLALSLGAFVAGRHRRWWLAALLGGLATLTRPLGIVVGLGLLVQFLRLRASWKRLLWLGFIPLALAGWMMYNRQLTGDPLTFIKTQAAWRRHMTNPIGSLLTGLTAPNEYDRASVQFWLVLMLVVFAVRKHLEPELQVYAWASFVLPLLSGIYSLPRYGLVIFPIYVGLARSQIPNPVRWVMIVGAAIVQVWLFMFWPTPGSWVV